MHVGNPFFKFEKMFALTCVICVVCVTRYRITVHTWSKQRSTISIEDEVLCGMIGMCLGTRLHCQQVNVHETSCVSHTATPHVRQCCMIPS